MEPFEAAEIGCVMAVGRKSLRGPHGRCRCTLQKAAEATLKGRLLPLEGIAASTCNGSRRASGDHRGHCIAHGQPTDASLDQHTFRPPGRRR